MSEERAETIKKMVEDLQLELIKYNAESGTPFFIVDHAAPKIPAELLADCSVVPDRNHIVSAMPKGGRWIEIGTQTGQFAREILDIAQPESLRVVDIDYGPFRRHLFDVEIASGKLKTIEKLSWEALEEFEDEYFDVVYIDADHTYRHVVRDIRAAVEKTKIGGTIICNDFTVWSPLEALSYGVYTAACEAIIEYEMPVTHFAFNPLGYHDIAFKKVRR